MIQPTLRAVTVFAAGIPLALFLVIYDPAAWPWAFDYGALVLVAVATDAALAFRPRLLGVATGMPDSLQVGERGAVTVTIAPTPHRRTTRFELVREQHPDADPGETAVIELAPGQAGQARFPVPARERGKIRIEALWVRWRGPLGLVQWVRRIEVARSIDVVPNVRGVRSSVLQFFSREALYGNKVQDQKGEGTEFDALRDYVAGLDSRLIDWKHSARHLKLVSKEFRTERNHQIILAIDTGHLMREPIGGIPRLDHAINAGLLLGYASLKGGDRVGLFGFDSRTRVYAEPLGGVDRFPRLQRLTAELDYAAEETNFTLGLTLLSQQLRRRSLVVLITDFIDTVTAELMVENLGRLSARHLVLFVTLQDPEIRAIVDASPEATPGSMETVARSVVAEEFRRERLIVFERLRRLGVQCLEAPYNRIGTDLINRYLAIKQRELI